MFASDVCRDVLFVCGNHAVKNGVAGAPPLSTVASPPSPPQPLHVMLLFYAGTLDELTSLFVETMLSRMECLERLSQLLKQRGDAAGAQQAQQGVEEASAKLMAMT